MMPRCPYCGQPLKYENLRESICKCEICGLYFKTWGKHVLPVPLTKPKAPKRTGTIVVVRRTRSKKEPPPPPQVYDSREFIASVLNISPQAADSFIQWAVKAYNIPEEVILSQDTRSIRLLYQEYLKHLATKPQTL